jgi:hypothetical protein
MTSARHWAFQEQLCIDMLKLIKTQLEVQFLMAVFVPYAIVPFV